MLAPGGRLLLAAPHEWEVHQAPHDYFRYTRFGLRYLLEKAGLEPIEMRAVGGYFRLLARRLLNGLQFFSGGAALAGICSRRDFAGSAGAGAAVLRMRSTASAISQPDTSARPANERLIRASEKVQLDGVIVVDKPEGWTSHDVVAKVRRIARTKRIGPPGDARPHRHRRAAAGARAGHAPGAILHAQRQDLRRRGALRLVHRYL